MFLLEISELLKNSEIFEILLLQIFEFSMPPVLFVLVTVLLDVVQLCTEVGVLPPLVELCVQGGGVSSCTAVLALGVHSWFGGEAVHS